MLRLQKADILRGLRRLDGRARHHGVLIDSAVCGGAAMAIAFDVRRATRDVDAVVRGALDVLRKAVAEMATEEDWPNDWLK